MKDSNIPVPPDADSIRGKESNSLKKLYEDDPLADREKDIVLSHDDAWAGSPDDVAACGEEDIGSGLEALVSDDQIPGHRQ